MTPDLTALAKVVAGGLPGGALDRTGRRHGGARVPRRRRRKVEHPGTHNAHPLAAAAGIATLDLLADGSAPGRRERRRRRAARGALRGLRAALDARLRLRPGRPRSASSSASARDDPVTLKRGVPEPLLSAAAVRDAARGRPPLPRLRPALDRPRRRRGRAHGGAPSRASLERLQDEGLHPVTHDLVVAGGHVLCPATGVDAIADVAIDDGRIAAVGEGLTGARARRRRRPARRPGPDRPPRARLRRRLALRHRRRHATCCGAARRPASTSDRPARRRSRACAAWSSSRPARASTPISTSPSQGMIIAARRRARGHPLGLGRAVRARGRGEPRRDRRRQAARGLSDGRPRSATGGGPRPRGRRTLSRLPLMVHVIDMGMPLPELLAQHATGRRRDALLPRQRRRPARRGRAGLAGGLRGPRARHPLRRRARRRLVHLARRARRARAGLPARHHLERHPRLQLRGSRATTCRARSRSCCTSACRWQR